MSNQFDPVLEELRDKATKSRKLILDLIELFYQVQRPEDREACLSYLETVVDMHLELVEKIHRVALRFHGPKALRSEHIAEIERRVFADDRLDSVEVSYGR